MKNLLTIASVAIMLLVTFSCSTQNNIPSANIARLLETNQFTFMAERANPMDADVIKAMNSLPGGGGSRMLNLDSGYTIEIRKEKLTVTLPYFGRMYNANMDSSKNSYRFTTTDFTVDKKQGKKGSSIYTIVAKDQQNVRTIYMEVFKNGKSYVSIDSNDRQSISYNGYIMENTMLKK